MPVSLPTRFELTVNVRTAKVLGRSCPLLHFVNLNVFADVRFAPILLQKSKIERDQKFRES